MEYWNIAEILPLLVQAMHDIRHGSLVSQNSLISSHVLLAPFAPIWHHGWCAPIVDILTSLLRPRPHVLKWSVLPRLPQHCFKDICIQTDPLKRPIGGMWNSPKAEKKRRNMHMKLVYKQTIDRETVHNKKKTKMACARKPELFVWTDNEVQLLLWLTLDYKASKLQETRTQAAVHHCCCCCCYETCAVQRSKARGRGVGRWCHRTESMQICRPHENARAAFFHPETRFQKSEFSGAAFTGSMWMISQNNAPVVRLY